MAAKLIRDARKVAITAGVRIVSSRNISGHYRFVLELPGGQVRKLSFPSSPSCAEFSLLHFQKHIKQLLATIHQPALKGTP